MSKTTDIQKANDKRVQEVTRALAAAMAFALTAESGGKLDWIAKKGPESLFSLIRKLMPEASM